MALIDSGASVNLIRKDIALVAKTGYKTKAKPYRIRTVRGTLLGKQGGGVKYKTYSRILRIQRHTERIQLDVTEDIENEMILGLR